VSFFSRIANLFDRTRIDREIEQELAAHLAMRTEDNVAAGMSETQARRNARVNFGNPTLVRERTTEADTALYLESLWADARYALRQLTRSPGFSLTAVLTLALGVGANLAVFQLLHAVLFGHLPIPEPERLYTVRAAPTPFDGAWYLSYTAYRHLRDAKPSTTPVIAHSWLGEGVLQQPDGATSRVNFQMISDNFFDALGLHPAAGRFFLSGDDGRLSSEWPVILRYSFFQQQFGADSSLLGKRFVVNGLPVVVVGIAPRGFNGLLQWNAPDIWFPLAAQSTLRLGTAFDSLGPGFAVNLDKPWEPQPTIFWLTVLSRAPLASQAALSAQWTTVLQSDIRLMASVTKDPRERASVEASQVRFVSAANGEGSLHRRYGTPLTILMAMSGAILLVGCLNLANLQLARLTQREREFSIRIALGASRARILRQVAMEALMLAVAGGLLALLTSRISSALLLQWASGRGSTMPIDLTMSPETGMLCALLLFAAVTAFGLLPAWHITGRNLPSMENSRSSKQTGQTRSARRWSNALLAAQVCFSLLLISAAALFAQTLRNITHTDTGMVRDQILSVHVDMHSTGFAEHEQAQQRDLNVFYGLVLDRLKSLPMVQDAAVSMCDIPMCGWNTFFHVFGHPELADDHLHGEENHVGPGYFRTLGIPLIEGRDFNQQDTLKTQRVAILNRTYARQLFGNTSPIGRWIGYNAPPGDHSFLIVGEIADALLNGPRNPAPAIAYLSITQDPAPIGTIEVRAHGNIDALPADLRNALHSVAPTLPITEITPLALELQDGLTTEQLLARLTTCFGALALALAALGFYGLLSFRVARRTSEIGIRMALGATRAQVQSLFLRQTVFILFAGILPGAALSLALHSLLDRLIDGPKTADPWPLTIATIVLASAGLLATLIPARRAASTDPMQALRSE